MVAVSPSRWSSRARSSVGPRLASPPGRRSWARRGRGPARRRSRSRSRARGAGDRRARRAARPRRAPRPVELGDRAPVRALDRGRRATLPARRAVGGPPWTPRAGRDRGGDDRRLGRGAGGSGEHRGRRARACPVRGRLQPRVRGRRPVARRGLRRAPAGTSPTASSTSSTRPATRSGRWSPGCCWRSGRRTSPTWLTAAACGLGALVLASASRTLARPRRRPPGSALGARGRRRAGRLRRRRRAGPPRRRRAAAVRGRRSAAPRRAAAAARARRAPASRSGYDDDVVEGLGPPPPSPGRQRRHDPGRAAPTRAARRRAGRGARSAHRPRPQREQAPVRVADLGLGDELERQRAELALVAEVLAAELRRDRWSELGEDRRRVVLVLRHPPLDHRNARPLSESLASCSGNQAPDAGRRPGARTPPSHAAAANRRGRRRARRHRIPLRRPAIAGTPAATMRAALSSRAAPGASTRRPQGRCSPARRRGSPRGPPPRRSSDRPRGRRARRRRARGRPRVVGDRHDHLRQPLALAPDHRRVVERVGDRRGGGTSSASRRSVSAEKGEAEPAGDRPRPPPRSSLHRSRS